MTEAFDTEVKKRRTFAVISHPDAGKTTLTEKLLLYGGAIALAGAVKGRKAARHATSDWMAMEQERGISVTTSVMQFPYRQAIVNLLDTPGHEDFSEDTYRTLSAVDSVLMVIDAAKGVEQRTRQLMEICRLRQTPIMTFINKMDREGQDPIDLLDTIETTLNIRCAPMTWPIGAGKELKGVYHLEKNCAFLYPSNKHLERQEALCVPDLFNPVLQESVGVLAQELQDSIGLVRGASHAFSSEAYLAGELTPVYFGSAMHNVGIAEWLDDFIAYAPPPLPRLTQERMVSPYESKLSGFIFKIQANMDPNHRDRIAFLRICSGQYRPGVRVKQMRTGRIFSFNQALTFLAGDREHTDSAFPGDIIGLHNHGTLHIGDSFSEGEPLHFLGIPYFVPELFRTVRLKDPLKSKALLKGLRQLSEEGATQVFRPLISQDLILGAVGSLQFDVVAFRLAHEYNAPCHYQPSAIQTLRWVDSDDPKLLEEFKTKLKANLALDMANQLCYLAPSQVNLNLTMSRWPGLRFHNTREHVAI